MGHALLNLTSLLDRKIHRGWHKLVGEATDVSETITVELGGEIELIVQWCHSPAKVAEVVPPRTPKPAAAEDAKPAENGQRPLIDRAMTQPVLGRASSVGVEPAEAEPPRRTSSPPTLLRAQTTVGHSPQARRDGADDPRLVEGDRRAVPREGERRVAFGQVAAERFQVLHGRLKIGLVAAGKGVRDDGDGGGA